MTDINLFVGGWRCREAHPGHPRDLQITTMLLALENRRGGRERERVSMHIEEFTRAAHDFEIRLRKIKDSAPHVNWYPYATMANIGHIDRLLEGDYRFLPNFIHGMTALDIGGADGDLACFLDSLGMEVDFVDNRVTNFNKLRGAQQLRKELAAKVRIHDLDLDSQFSLPRNYYDIAFFLGTLYHLKNPFYALERISVHAKYCFLSTRIARYTVGRRLMRDQPLAYLVGRRELNNDPTNFWIFSERGLKRLLHRAGWIVCLFTTFGDTVKSNPVAAEHDERAFCLVKSARIGSAKYLAGWHAPHVRAIRWTEQTADALLLSGRRGQVLFSGYVPERVYSAIYGRSLTVSVFVDGELAERVPLSPSGRFRIRLDVSRNKLLRLRAELDRSCSSAQAGLRGGERACGVIVNRLEAY
ncbi:MAG: methyltransferase domain-containing protein [Planctomycetota bacterium]